MGKRPFAEVFALVVKDVDVVIEQGENYLKQYRLPEPVRAYIDRLIEVYDQVDEKDLYSQKLLADARMNQVYKLLRNIKIEERG